MNFLHSFFVKRSNPLLSKNENVRLKYVSGLSQLEASQTLAPLLFAHKDRSENIRALADSLLVQRGIEPNQIDVNIIYESMSWTKGLVEWDRIIKTTASAKALAGLATGLGAVAAIGFDERNMIGFLFVDAYQAVKAALELKAQHPRKVYIWSDCSMVSYELGYDIENLSDLAEEMLKRGASKYAAVNCTGNNVIDALEKVFNVEPELSWTTSSLGWKLRS